MSFLPQSEWDGDRTGQQLPSQMDVQNSGTNVHISCTLLCMQVHVVY